jgi:hypothetical protein
MSSDSKRNFSITTLNKEVFKFQVLEMMLGEIQTNSFCRIYMSDF